jgi:hypothetical protein
MVGKTKKILGQEVEEVKNPWRETPFGKKETYLRRKRDRR